MMLPRESTCFQSQHSQALSAATEGDVSMGRIKSISMPSSASVRIQGWGYCNPGRSETVVQRQSARRRGLSKT